MSDFEKKVKEFQKNIESLGEKVQKAAEKFVELSKERDALKAQIEFLQADNVRARAVITENERLKRDRIWVQNRIDKLAGKIESIGL